jgi:hypothetical protein
VNQLIELLIRYVRERFGTTVLVALVALALVVAGSGIILGPAIGVLVLAAVSLVLAIAAMWRSVRALVGETPLSKEEAFAMGAPSAEEEQKRAVLRAIKDIEFEHAVGKLSDADYQELLARYRAEAKRLLRVLDERSAPDRERAQRLAQEKLAAEGLAEPPSEERSQGLAKTKKKKKKKKATGKSCNECGANNDVDAAFCKACGKALGIEARAT